MSLCSVTERASACAPTGRELLGDDEVEAEVGDSRTAELLGHGHRQ